MKTPAVKTLTVHDSDGDELDFIYEESNDYVDVAPGANNESTFVRLDLSDIQDVIAFLLSVLDQEDIHDLPRN